MNDIASACERFLWTLACIVCACMGVGLAPAFAQTQVQSWHTNLDEAARVSRATGKPIFLVFRCVR